MSDTKQSGAAVPPQREFTLDELATRTGTPQRTIRYYIARGILAGPARSGRGAFYTNEHLEGIESIRRSQREGRTLAEIERESRGNAPSQELVEPEAWWAYPIAPDVVVEVRGGLSPWRTRQIKNALAKLAEALRPGDGKRKEEEPDE